MKSWQRLKTQTGFVEIEYLIAAGLVVLLVGSVSAGLAMMSKFQRSNDAAADSYYMLQQMMTTFRTADACTTALAGRALPTAGAEVPFSMNLDMGTGPVSVAAGAEPVKGVKIETLSLVHNNLLPSAAAAPTPQPIVTTAGTYTQHVVNVRLMTEKMVEGQSSGFVKPKDIPVSVIANAAGQIQFCEIDAAEARACSESGGKWDPTAPKGYTATQPRCKPHDAHCDFAGSFSIADSACGPNTFVNPVTGGRSCPTGYVRQRTGTLAQSVQSGKETVNNVFCPIYTCVRCADRSPPMTDAPITPAVSVGNASINQAIIDNYQDQVDQNNLILNNRNWLSFFP